MNSNRGHAQSLKACALGFSLLEVVIAIAVISVTFIGLIGLLGLGVVTDQTSSQQARLMLGGLALLVIIQRRKNKLG